MRNELNHVLCALATLSVFWGANPGFAGENQIPAGFIAGETLSVAPSLKRSQIGRSEEGKRLHSTIPQGTADVFGNGPYDLFVNPARLFPFEGFDSEGTPLYGSPQQVQGGENQHVFTGQDGVIYGLRVRGRRVFLQRFSRSSLTFQDAASSAELKISGSLGGGIAAYVADDGRLHVYSSISTQSEYRPPGPHHHSAEFMPYDGAGFWRGKIPRRGLVHICFSGVDLRKVEKARRVSKGPGEFLFSVRGMAIARVAENEPPCLISSEKQSVLRCFPINSGSGAPGAWRYINTSQHVALRHPAINPSVKAIHGQNSNTDDLIVGDSGRIWFYKASGELSDNGSPIYSEPRPLMARGVALTLGNLPVISPGDMDGDGLTDLMAGNNTGQLLFIRNVGTSDQAEFSHPVAVPVGGQALDIKAGYRGSIQGPGEAMWGYTCPTVCDWNNDGHMDVILNSIMADYKFLQQLPSEDGLKFAAAQDMYCDGLQLHLAWRSQPGITSWGQPDQKFMIALDEQNLLRQFRRVDNHNVHRGELLRLVDGSPITANVDEAAGQTGRVKIVACDWDNDGDVDLLLGTSRGLSIPAGRNKYLPSHRGDDRKASVLLLRNVGSNESPRFSYVREVQFGGKRIQLGIHSCSPALIDIGRGRLDLLVGEEAGAVRFYPKNLLSVATSAPE